MLWMVGFGIGSGVPKLQPVVVQSGSALLTAGAVDVGPMSQLAPVQLSENRLCEPSGVGPSGMREAPAPMLSRPQARLLLTVFEPSRVSPQLPVAALRTKSRNAPPTDIIVVVVVELVAVVVELVLVVGLVVLVVELVAVVVELVLVVGLVVLVVGLVVLVVGLVVLVVGLVVLVVGVVVLVVALVVLVVGLVVLVVELVAVVVELVLVVGLVVVVTPHAGRLGSPVQEQTPLRQFAIRSLRHLLKALALKPGHAAATSSEHTFGLHSFPGGWTTPGVAVASETKPPAVSRTAASVTAGFLVISEPLRGLPAA